MLKGSVCWAGWYWAVLVAQRGTCIIKGVDRPVGRKIPEPKTWELPGSFYHVDWGQRGSPN